MLVPWKALNRRHVTTTQCDKGAERKRRWLEEEKMQESEENAFQAYGRPLVMFTLFKYLGRVLMAVDENWLAAVGNLRKKWKSWTWMAKILVREVAIPRVSGMFFKAVVQAVLLFGSDMWVMNPHMGRDLGSFHQRVVRLITGRHLKQY